MCTTAKITWAGYETARNQPMGRTSSELAFAFGAPFAVAEEWLEIKDASRPQIV